MGWVLVVIAAIVIAAVVLSKMDSDATDARKATLLSALTRDGEHESTQSIISVNAMKVFSVDEKHRRVAIAELAPEAGTVTVHRYDFRDLLSAEILEDGASVVTTSRSSQVGGALLGGLALGGVGVLLGGLSAKQHATDAVTKAELRVVVNDTRNPVHSLLLIGARVQKDSGFYQTQIEHGRRWHSLISVLIRQADDEDKRIAQAEQRSLTAGNGALSLADEIAKLAALRDQGLLTGEQFEAQKIRLLGAG